MIANPVQAQDLIILKTGDEIKSKVNEIGPDLIKYKKFENLTGPDYTVQKNTVFMIKYENGTRDVFTEQTTPKPQTTQAPIPKTTEPDVQNSSVKTLQVRGGAVKLDGKWIVPSEVRRIMNPYPEALRSYNTGKTLAMVGDFVGYGVIITCIGTAINANSFSSKQTAQVHNAYVTGLMIAIPLFAVDITLTIIGNAKVRSSVNLYNSSINKPVTYNLNFGIQESGGVGFALKF